MSQANAISDLERAEHSSGTKKVSAYGYDGSNLVLIKVNADGELVVNSEPTSVNLEGGGKVSVGTTAVEATFTGATKSVIISADASNTGTLYVGKSGVTSAGANALCFLLSGESVTVDYDDATNALFVVASAASQYFFKGALI